MSINDLLSDMFSRIRNGQNAKLAYVTCPFSNVCKNVLSVLEAEGFITAWEEENDSGKRSLTVQLKYHDGEPVIKILKRISRPGCRHYSSVEDLKPVYNGMGVAILSTDRGVVSDNFARTENVGGEVLCYVF